MLSTDGLPPEAACATCLASSGSRAIMSLPSASVDLPLPPPASPQQPEAPLVSAYALLLGAAYVATALTEPRPSVAAAKAAADEMLALVMGARS